MSQTEDEGLVQVASRPAVTRAVEHIQKASHDTGISFSYLMAQAGKESNFQTDTHNRKSSAAGLFQFTKSTWMQLVKNHGAAHGLGDVADKIQKTAHGDYVVHDPVARQEILDLRRDPQMSALMAGEYARDNKTYLERQLNRPVDSTDLYMAHFLGPWGAAKVLKARDQDPSQSAAAVVPQAAHKNHNVFFDNAEGARSVADVYDRIHRAIDKPMRQYAKLEVKPTGEGADATVTAGTEIASGYTATGKARHSRHHHDAAPPGLTAPVPLPANVASAGPDTAWPFETGQWPPQYIPPAPVAVAAQEPEDSSAQRVAYTDASRSADSISAPMPPAAGGSPDDPAGSFGKLFNSMKKSLFG